MTDKSAPHQSALRWGRRDIPNHCYFVTATIAGRRPALADPVAARIVVDCLCWLQHHEAIRLMGFVVMPDHMHFAFVLEPTTSRPGGRSYNREDSGEEPVGAASRPRPSLANVMRGFKSYTARRINEAFGLTGPLWQTAYHDHLVRDRKDFETRLRYMHGNPVRKGLSRFEHDYVFSTAHPKFAHLIDWAWLDGIEPGRGREAAPTLSAQCSRDSLQAR